MKKLFVNLMHVNRGERNGAFALIIIGLLFLTIPEVYRWLKPKPSVEFAGFELDIERFRTSMKGGEAHVGDGSQLQPMVFPFNPNTASYEDFLQLGLSERTAKSICNYRDKGGKFRKPEDFKKIYTLSDADYERLSPYIQMGDDNMRLKPNQAEKTGESQVFNFDPNTVTEDELIRLGIPKWAVSRVINYRTKGGKFRKKEDLSKIYGFPEKDYQRLEPYITIASAEEDISPRPLMFSSGANSYSKNTPTSMGPLDINRASAEHWQILPGIGQKRAEMIIKYREKLGGFISVTQVGEVRGLPDSVYQYIRPMLLLQFSEPRKLNINLLSTEELDAHPYITPRQASLIVADRSQNGDYRKVEDLLRIPVLIDKVWLEKIRPYLDVH